MKSTYIINSTYTSNYFRHWCANTEKPDLQPWSQCKSGKNGIRDAQYGV